MKKCNYYVLALVAILSMVSTAQANTALYFTDLSNHGFLADLLVGRGFVPNENITLTRLGYYDSFQDGLNNDHEVFLYRVSDMSLLASGMVTTNEPLSEFFRYIEVAPILLEAGETYFVAGYDPDDALDRIGIPAITDLSWAPEITFDGWQARSGLLFDLYSTETEPWAASDGYMIVANFHFEPEVVEVAIDIKPGSCPNPLRVNFRGNGVIPVAILGSDDFNVYDIDLTTITLEGVRPIRSSFEDVSTPVDGEECECSTEEPDEYLDLVLKFDRQDIIAALEDTHGELTELPNRIELTLTLTAMLIGEEVELKGKDCLRILNRGRIKRSRR